MNEIEILYGKQVIREVLRAGRRQIHALRIQAGSQLTGPMGEVLAEARRRRIEPRPCEKRELDRLTKSGHHQGVVAEVSPYPYLDVEDLWTAPDGAAAAEAPFLLVLDHLQDPQNLGALMRSAEVAGVTGLIIPRDRAAPVTPAVVRASSGAAEHLRVAVAGNLGQAVDALRAHGVRVIGLEAVPEARPWTEVALGGPLALVVGSEGEGLTRIIRKRCDALMRLPVKGRVNSLNAAVAGAIALFEARRQRDLAATGAR